MNYDPRKNKIQIDLQDARRAADLLLHALVHVREQAGKPLDRYPDPKDLDHCEFAQKQILDAAEALGIDLGAKWGHELDLREVGR